MAFLILVILSILYIKIADRYNIMDKPNIRSSHTKPVIRGGGILFLFSIIIFYAVTFRYHYFVLGLIIISVISFIDDLKDLKPSVRLIFQFIAIILTFIELGLYNYDLYIISLMIILSVGTINLFNFMDGINGITGLYSLSILLGFYIINIELNVLNQSFLLYVIFSVIIFLYYNLRKKSKNVCR